MGGAVDLPLSPNLNVSQRTDLFGDLRPSCDTRLSEQPNPMSTIIKVGETNRDPTSGELGAHPVGTGIGAAGGAAAGAAVGSVVGPVGMLIGGAIGAVVGGAAGHDAAEDIDPTIEVEYWRSNYSTRPYADPQYQFDTDFRPAFVFGVDSRNRYSGRQWDDALADHLRSEWDLRRGPSSLNWNQAQSAVRDAWDRTDRTFIANDANDRYYEARFADAQYRDQARSFVDYRHAYRYGTYARTMNPGRVWDDSIDAELERGWPLARGASSLSWDQARAAVHDAWDSYEQVGRIGNS